MFIGRFLSRVKKLVFLVFFSILPGVAFSGVVADYSPGAWELNEEENRVENASTGIWNTISTDHAMPQILELTNNLGIGGIPGYLITHINGFGTDGNFKIYIAYDANRYHTLGASKDTNRMYLYMSLPNGNFTFHIGTYSKDPTISTSGLGMHYYHYFSLQGNDNQYWTKLLINKHPQHQVGEKYDPGDNPTEVNGYDYFDGMSRMYLQMRWSEWQDDESLFSPYDVQVDEIVFYQEDRQENTYSINSLAVTYFGEGEFNLDWRSFSQYEIHHETFEVRYSTQPIETDEDYNAATLVPGSPSGGWGQENIGHHENAYRAHFTIPGASCGDTYYFAIKDLYPSHPKTFTVINYTIEGFACSGGSFQKEDVNRDNAVDIQDVQIVTNVILGNAANDRADVNGDDHVTISDVQEVVNSIL